MSQMTRHWLNEAIRFTYFASGNFVDARNAQGLAEDERKLRGALSEVNLTLRSLAEAFRHLDGEIEDIKRALAAQGASLHNAPSPPPLVTMRTR